jgi:hypothetical protein
MHLDERTYGRILAGDLDPALARALAAHLEGDCEACEAFLAAREDADFLDGAVDRALQATGSPPAGAAGNDLEYARIRRSAHPPARRRLRAGPALAAAAAVAMAGLAGLYLWSRAPPAWDGEKGAAPGGVPARLRFVVVDGAALEKGVSGQRVPASAGLAFEVELGRAAEVALVRVGDAGAADVFFHGRLGSGRSEIAAGGRPAAYPLDGLSGAQRFVLVASDTPLAPERAARAAASPAAPAEGAAREGLSLDQVEVIVR